MEDLEFLQGLEDLRALVRIEDLVGHSWEKMKDHFRDWKRASHNGDHEIWESETPEKTSNPTPAVGFLVLHSRSDANTHVPQAELCGSWTKECCR